MLSRLFKVKKMLNVYADINCNLKIRFSDNDEKIELESMFPEQVFFKVLFEVMFSN